MPGTSLLKATLLKETYVPLAKLNGAEQNHDVVRVLPSRLSLRERRCLDQIAPKVFPVRKQFNELRQAARLQRAGFRIKDLIRVYERLIAAAEKKSREFELLKSVDEDSEFTPVEPHQLVSTSEGDVDDKDFDQSTKSVPDLREEAPTNYRKGIFESIAISPEETLTSCRESIFESLPKSPEVTLTTYRNAIFENVMVQLQEKWLEFDSGDTLHPSRLQNVGKNKVQRERSRREGTDGKTSEKDNVISRSCSLEDSEPDENRCYDNSDSCGSTEIASGKSAAEAASTSTTWASWQSDGCHEKSPSSTVSVGNTAPTSSGTPSKSTRRSRTTGSLDAKMVVIMRYTGDDVGGEANVTTHSGKSVNVESLSENTTSPEAFERESQRSLRRLLRENPDPRIKLNATHRNQGFVSRRSTIEEDNELKWERSLVKSLRHSRQVNEVVDRERNRNIIDDAGRGRNLHFTNVEKSRLDGASVETEQVSPSGWSEVSGNSPTEFIGDSHHRSIERFSKLFGESQSPKESRVLPEAKPSKGRLSDSLGRSLPSSHALDRSPGRSSPTFLKSISMIDQTLSPEAKQDVPSTRAGVPNRLQNLPVGSPRRRSTTFLQSLTLEGSSVIDAFKENDSGRSVGVPDGIRISSDKSRGSSEHDSLERFSNSFGRSQSMMERTALHAAKQDSSAKSPDDGPEWLERPANLSLANKIAEKIQTVIGRSPSRTRFQPEVESKAKGEPERKQQTTQERNAEKNSKLSNDEALDENDGDSSSIAQAGQGNDVQTAAKGPQLSSGTNLRNLLVDGRNEESDESSVKTCAAGIFRGIIKRVSLCRRVTMVRAKIIATLLGGLGWMNNASKVRNSPKRSLIERRVTVKGRTRRSSTRRTMVSPKQGVEPTRKPVKPVGLTADESKQSLSLDRSVSKEGWPTGTSTNKVYSLGWLLEGHPDKVASDMDTLAGNAEGLADLYYLTGHNENCMEQFRLLRSPRQTRPHSISSRFRREHIERLRMSPTEAGVAGG